MATRVALAALRARRFSKLWLAGLPTCSRAESSAALQPRRRSKAALGGLAAHTLCVAPRTSDGANRKDTPPAASGTQRASECESYARHYATESGWGALMDIPNIQSIEFDAIKA